MSVEYFKAEQNLQTVIEATIVPRPVKIYGGRRGKIADLT